MNYIKQINAFYDWLETNSISSSSIVLWHALMSINNKTGWKREFSVAISTLEIKTSLTKKTLERARNNLKTTGLIDWRSRKGNKSAVYKMNSIIEILQGNNDAQSEVWGNDDPQSVAQPVPQSVAQCVPLPVAINKLNETKLDIDIERTSDEFLSLVNYLEIECKGAYLIEELASYLGLMEKDLITEAIKRSENKSVQYALRILENWNKKGITKLDDIKPEGGIDHGAYRSGSSRDPTESRGAEEEGYYKQFGFVKRAGMS